MELHAVNKYIDTRRIRNLLTVGEHNVDEISIRLPRRYMGKDLAACRFILRCVNARHQLLEQTLPAEVQGSDIVLLWKITEDATAVSGTLYLELRGVQEETLIIKYYMPPIAVRSSPCGEGLPSKDVVETTLNQMQALLDEAKVLAGKVPKLQNGTWWFYDADASAYVDSGIAVQGKPGEAGKSAFQLWLDQGNTGDIDAFFKALKGKDGSTAKRQTVYLDAQTGSDQQDGLTAGKPMQTIAAALEKYASCINLRLQLAAGTYSGSVYTLEHQKVAFVGAGVSATTICGRINGTDCALTLSALTVTADSGTDPIVSVATGSHLYGYRVNFSSVNGAECLRISTASQCYLDGSVFVTDAETDTVIRSSGGAVTGLGYCTVPGVVHASTTGEIRMTSCTVKGTKAESGGVIFVNGVQV